MHDDLPGADLVRDGLADLVEGRMTSRIDLASGLDVLVGESDIAALLVAIGAPRLRRLGLPLPADPLLPQFPERDLYELLEGQGRGAHSRFNALVRRLVSFERALEHARMRTEEGDSNAER